MQYKIKNHIIIALFKILNIIISLFFSYCRFKDQSNHLKIAICTMAKKENLYIKEFVNYYKKIGVDHIYIYDDNDKNSEKISDVIDKKYNKYVTIYDKNENKPKNQHIAFTNCYNNNKNKYDWIFMFDIDEYLIIVNETLKNYLSNEIFKDCDFIKIHWVQPSDNNLLYYDNRTLFERFKGPYKKDTHIKTLVRGNIEGLKYAIHSPKISPKRNITCNNVGHKFNFSQVHFQDVFDINIDKAYIIHYKYKSTEEYINKYKRGYRWENSKFMEMRIREYFEDNIISLQKIELMEKQLKINLSEYRKQINK